MVPCSLTSRTSTFIESNTLVKWRKWPSHKMNQYMEKLSSKENLKFQKRPPDLLKIRERRCLEKERTWVLLKFFSFLNITKKLWKSRESKTSRKRLKVALLHQRLLTTQLNNKEKPMGISALIFSSQSQRDGLRTRNTKPTIFMISRRARKNALSDLQSMTLQVLKP